MKKCIECQSENLDDIFLLGTTIYAESKQYGRQLSYSRVDSRACMDCGRINMWVQPDYYQNDNE